MNDAVARQPRRHTLLGVVVVASLVVVAPASAEPSELPAPSAAAPPEPAVATARATPAPPQHGLVQKHSLGLGFHVVLMQTEASDRYALHGPAIAYNYFIGRRWGALLRLAAFFPILGTMEGPGGNFSGSLIEIYDQHRYGIDGLLMVARRIPVAERLEVVTGLGPHIQSFSLAGARYSPVEDASLGIGGLGKIDYAFNGWLSASTQLAIGLDLFDLVDHRNPADLVVPLSWTFAVDARY